MERLKKCYSLRKKINSIDEDIETLTLTVTAPRGQDFSGMPRSGSSPVPAADRYLLRKERLEARRTALSVELLETWAEAIIALEKAGVTTEARHLMKLRYYHGLSWKECSKAMSVTYPNQNWNKNKCFASHRIVCAKLTKITDKFV